MLYLLSSEAYAAALPIFDRMDDQLAPLAVLSRKSAGQVWVDDPACPRSALLKVGHRVYLAGAHDQAGFNEAAARLFAETITPAAQAAGDWGFMVYYHEEGWQAVIEGGLLAGCKLYPGPRQYYELDLTKPSFQAEEMPPIPDGFQIKEVNRDLAADLRLTNLADLTEEMCSERESVDDFLANSFGTVMVTGSLLATWCLSEYNLDDRCEVGIATVEEYRRRGLAAITGAAFIRQARSMGIRRIGWHCWTRNEGSVATAGRLGFALKKDLQAYFVAIRES